MANHPGFHKIDKRKKELARLKKQEEKKFRRLNKAASAAAEDPRESPEEPRPSSAKEIDVA